LFCLVLLLLTFLLGSFALLLPALLSGFMLFAALFVLRLALLCLFFGLLLGCWLHDRDGVLCFLSGKPGGGSGIMHRAMAIGANGDGLSGISSEDNQCGLRVGAWRFGIRVVGYIEFTIGVFGKNASTLFLDGSPRSFDLD